MDAKEKYLCATVFLNLIFVPQKLGVQHEVSPHLSEVRENVVL